MNHTSPTLTIPLLIFTGVLIASIGLVKFTLDKAQAAEQKFNVQQGQLREATTRVQKSGAEKELVIRYLPGYRQLSSIGFVGDEPRINWLDALRVVNQKSGLFGVDYDISPRRPYPLAPTLAPGQMNIMQSVMKLRLPLLHEADLPGFFEFLYNQQAGVFMVDQCTIRRTTTAPVLRYQANLAADCQLSWITAQPMESAPATP